MDEKTIVNADTLNGEESLESIIESTDTAEQKLAKLEEANKKLYARAKAAEEKAKAPKPLETPLNTQNSLTRDEAMLIAQGIDNQSLEMLNKISKLEGVSLLEAKNSELYSAYLAKNEQAKKSEAAKLGASRGSGRIEPQKTSGLTREEHMALFREKMGT